MMLYNMFCSLVSFSLQDVLFVDQWKCPQCLGQKEVKQVEVRRKTSGFVTGLVGFVTALSRYLTCSPNSQAARDFKNALLWLSSIGNLKSFECVGSAPTSFILSSTILVLSCFEYVLSFVIWLSFLMRS